MIKKLFRLSCIVFVLFFLVGHSLVGEAQIKTTHTYATVDGEDLMLDIYHPKNQTEKSPVLIWMHGGGFSGGTRDNQAEVKFMEEIVNRGYVGVSISYRLLRKGEPTGFGCDCPAETKRMIFREAAKDFWKAVDFIYERADDFHVDTNNIIVGGSSAGAEGVLNAIYLKDWVFEDQSNEEYEAIENISIAGVISLAGALVDERYITDATVVPGIFYHGVEDNLVPYETAPHHYCDPNRAGYIWLDGGKTIYEHLKEKNVSSVLTTYTKGKHEISGIPFQDFDNLFNWINRLFINKEQANIHLIKEKR